MKTLKRTSLFLFSSVLIACGSGGGGGGSAPASDPKPVNEAAAESTTQQTVDNTNSANSSQQAANDTKAENSSQQAANDTKPANTSQQVAAGTEPMTNTSIELSSVGLIDRTSLGQGKIKDVNIGYGKITGYNNKYSFSGVWRGIDQIKVDGAKLTIANLSNVTDVTDLEQLNKVLTEVYDSRKNLSKTINELVYFGSDTPVANIPTTGIYTYKGSATRYDNLTNSVANVGKSNLVANFGTKKISGELVMDGIRRNISLKSANIVGNKFEGAAVAGNLIVNEVNGRYEGRFYGPNVDEIAGKATFSKNSDLDTIFNADLTEKKISVTK